MMKLDAKVKAKGIKLEGNTVQTIKDIDKDTKELVEKLETDIKENKEYSAPMPKYTQGELKQMHAEIERNWKR